MTTKVLFSGSGTQEDPRYIPLDERLYESWEESDGGTAEVVLSKEGRRTAKSDAVKAANALNVGSAWSDVGAVFGDDSLLPAVKKWLAQGTDSVGPVKKAWSGFTDPVPQGFVVSHGAALWRATAETSAEPSTSSDDWTLIFSL